jgi:hypothetical protein
MLFGIVLNWGASPTEMPLRYWGGLVVVFCAAFIPTREHSFLGINLDVAIYFLTALLSILWFRQFMLSRSFGIWCLLPIFLILVKMKGYAHLDLNSFGEIKKIVNFMPFLAFYAYFSGNIFSHTRDIDGN